MKIVTKSNQKKIMTIPIKIVNQLLQIIKRNFKINNYKDETQRII